MQHLRFAGKLGFGLLAAFPFWAVPAQAQTTTLDGAATAWVLVSVCLVLLMTIPGLALPYAGMVRKKNVLSTLMQSFAACCLLTLLWMFFGYSLAFAPGNAWIGDASKFFWRASARKH
jgi:Amt family ammonium transporter